jgi:hypothetical protein
MTRLLISCVVLLATLAAATPAPAGGTTYDKLAYLTFSHPVQVPGATLYPGTYRFRLANPSTGRNVMQVLSGDGVIVYSMFHTIPDARSTVTADPFVTFREAPVGVALPVDALFYGGEHRGYAFVYPAGGPSLVPWQAAPIEVEPWAPRRWMPEPLMEPVPRYTPTQPIESFPMRFPQSTELAPLPAELPRTATALPLVAAGGFASLFAGLALAFARRRW